MLLTGKLVIQSKACFAEAVFSTHT